jgi:hypothetical protein
MGRHRTVQTSSWAEGTNGPWVPTFDRKAAPSAATRVGEDRHGRNREVVADLTGRQGGVDWLVFGCIVLPLVLGVALLLFVELWPLSVL